MLAEHPVAVPVPGTPEYMSTLLAYVHAAHPVLPLDQVVLQSLMLCLVARIPKFLTPSNDGSLAMATQDSPDEESILSGTCANLILRTREEDVAVLLHIVSLMLTTIFGLPTHKHKIASRAHISRAHKSHPRLLQDDPSVSSGAFLRSLFFRRSVSSGSARLSADMTPRMRTKSLRTAHAHRRSSSQTPRPSPLRLSRSIEQVSTEENMEYFIDNMSMASSRRPLLMASSITPSSTVRSRRAPARTEPLPLGLSMSGFTSPEDLASPPASLGSEKNAPEIKTGAPVEEPELRPMPLLSSAVVVSGLEHASIQSQRALNQVLGQRRLILDEGGGVWNLPDDFVMVYVCKADPHERPPLLRGLLDKFALSADITIAPAARQAYATYRGNTVATPHSSPFATARSLPHLDQLPTSPKRTPTALSGSVPSASSVPQSHVAHPVVPAADLTTLRALASPVPCMEAHAYTNIHPSLTSYLRDLFSATRHHPLLDGTSLTHRVYTDAEALARAFRVLAGDSLGVGLLQSVLNSEPESPSAGIMDGERSVAESADWQKELVGMDWAAPQGAPMASYEHYDDGRSERSPLNVELPHEMEDGAGVTPTLGTPPPGLPKETEVWDVSEVDIARIFPRVVSHRLRIRDGFDDEILGSIMWPATGAQPQLHRPGKQPEDDVKSPERTVKEVLVEILADV